MIIPETLKRKFTSQDAICRSTNSLIHVKHGWNYRSRCVIRRWHW